ncbi:DNA topoisomerase IB [Parvularcula sp. ZS-1/3]|uniref:DNA topoisomerase n=1 Tax=Parvularcula mediterranea TaxID=2732508 RepID=A0A7Y3W6P1_9PROT|nr:DNA topoisomerase IB [Parvularcula mediterranea]NNU17481.1 DNA topoisomerase IB [Parvularcula mediterranea]
MRTDSEQDARAAGLIYSSDAEPGFARRKRGRGWSFYDPGGSLVRDPEVRERCLGLAIPPAYEDVWICSHPKGHLQATGRDERGRKAYLYHEAWRAYRDRQKYDLLAEFGARLGTARLANEERRRGRKPTRERVLAAMFALLDQHALRVGHEAYTEENGSFGLTTLRADHLDTERHVLSFTAKGGKDREVLIDDRKLFAMLEKLAGLPGETLAHFDDDGEARSLCADDVNEDLSQFFGETGSAKSFRTWHGSVAAFEAGLSGGAKVDDVLEAAASRLGNTKAIARTSYVHPAIVDAVKDGSLAESGGDCLKGRSRKGLTQMESGFLRWLTKISQ